MYLPDGEDGAEAEVLDDDEAPIIDKITFVD